MVKKLLTNNKLLWLFALLLTITSILLLFACFKEVIIGGKIFNGNHYDFLAFYSAADLSWHGHLTQIYNQSIVSQLQLQFVTHPVGIAGYMPFMNPPAFALLISPLALTSITNARIIWLIVSFLVLVTALLIITKPLPKWQRLASVAVLVGTFPVYQALIEGQQSVFLLLFCLLAYKFALKNRLILSGIFLVPLFIKPQIAFFAAVGLLIMKRWKVLVSMLITATAICVAILPVTGIKIYITYLKYIMGAANGHFVGAGATIQTVWKGNLSDMAGINGFFAALVGQKHVTWVNALTFITIFFAVILFILAFKKVKFGFLQKDKALMLAGYITLVLLVNPHFYIQDVVLIYLILPLLFVVSKKYMFASVLILSAACNLLFIDQKSKIHLFTLIAFGFCIVVFTKFIKIKHKNS